MGYVEVRCYKCRMILSTSDDEVKGYPRINYLIVDHYRKYHNKEIPIDRAINEVIVLGKVNG